MFKFPSKFFVCIALLVLAACAGTSAAPKGTADPLAGTRWQLDSIDYMDDSTFRPDDSAKYTLEFDAQAWSACKPTATVCGAAIRIPRHRAWNSAR